MSGAPRPALSHLFILILALGAGLHSEEDESRLLELLRERARLLTNERAVGASGHLFCVGPDSCG